MELLYGIKRLDDYERWAGQLLAARGLRIEIQACTGQPYPDGWYYGALVIKNIGKPFIAKFLTRLSEIEVPSYPCDPRLYAETEGQIRKLHNLIVAIWAVRESIKQGHAEASFIIGMHMQDYVNQLQDERDAPIIREAVINLRQTVFANKDRRVQLPKRAVMCAMDAGYQATSEVKNFLMNESCLTDGWGAFDIEPAKDAYILTDTKRNFTERTLQVTRIPTLISEIKQRYYD